MTLRTYTTMLTAALFLMAVILLVTRISLSDQGKELVSQHELIQKLTASNTDLSKRVDTLEKIAGQMFAKRASR